MRYVAALFAVLLLAAAVTPAAAGPHNRPHNHGYGTPYGHVRGHVRDHGAQDRHDRGQRPPHHRGHRGDGPRVMGPHPHVRVKPLDSILHGLRRQHPGRHLFVRGVYGPNGEPYLRVKWLTPDGRVLWFYVDARTGQEVNDDGARQQPPQDGS